MELKTGFDFARFWIDGKRPAVESVAMVGFLFGLWLGGLLVTLVTVRTENEDGSPLSGAEYFDSSVFLPVIFWPFLIGLIAIRTFADGGDDPQDFPFV